MTRNNRVDGSPRARACSAFCAVSCAFFSLLAAAGCAGSAPDAARASWRPGDCACTLEYRRNLCVTVNGAPAPDSLAFRRERAGGLRDSLEAAGPRCFGELREEPQRVLMLRQGVVVDSTGWFSTPTVDCCHAEARTVDFKMGSGK